MLHYTIEPIFVDMTPVEWQIVRRLAWNLQEAAQERGAKNKRMTPLSDLRAHMIGLAGEYAFAKHFGLRMNLDLSERDPGYDFVINGCKVDVKTRFDFRGADLLVPSLSADVFVLAEFFKGPTNIGLVGWAAADAFRERGEGEYAYRPDHIVERDRLTEMELFQERAIKARPSPQAQAPSKGRASDVALV